MNLTEEEEEACLTRLATLDRFLLTVTKRRKLVYAELLLVLGAKAHCPECENSHFPLCEKED